MCEECRMIPCHPRCPNAPEPKQVFVCSGCGGEIVEGDDYWDIMGEQFCESCIYGARKEAVYDAFDFE
jgi:hypothetical protein